MGLGKHGVPLTTQYDPRPTGRDIWAAKRHQMLESGAMEEHLIPWAEAKAMGILTRLHHKGKPKLVRLAAPVAAFIAREQQREEDSLGPAIVRLIERGALLTNFHTQQRQKKGAEQGEEWAGGALLSPAEVDAAAAETKRLEDQKQDLLRRYRR